MGKSTGDILDEIDMKWEGGILFHKDKKLCNFVPIAGSCYLGTESGKHEYQVTVCVGEGKAVIDCTATLKAISDVNFWRDLSDSCIIFPEVSNKVLTDCMRCIIQAQIYEGMPEKSRIDALGWYKDNEYTGYCAGSTVYPPLDNRNIEVAEKIASEYQIASHADKDAGELFGELKEMLSLGSPIAVTCWLCDIAAKLYTVFKWCKIYFEFVVWLVGKTSSYKTTTAKYFAHMYGDDRDIGGMMAELSATKGALEMAAETCKDCEFIMDDLAPTVRKMTEQEKAEMVSTLIRQATNPVDAVKRHGNKIRRTHVEGILVFTSEENIRILSIMNRLILLDVNRFPIGEKMLRFMKQHPGFPVEISLLIIEDVARDFEGYERLIIDKMSLHMNEERVDSWYSRFRRNYMCLRTVWDVILKVAENRNIDLSGEAYLHVQNAMNEIMNYHANELKSLSFQQDQYAPIRMLFDAILTIENSGMFDVPVEGEIEYEKKKGCFYLLPSEATRYLFQKTGQIYTDRKLSLLLSAVGALRKDKSKKSTKKYNKLRHWVLDETVVEEFMEWRE